MNSTYLKQLNKVCAPHELNRIRFTFNVVLTLVLLQKIKLSLKEQTADEERNEKKGGGGGEKLKCANIGSQ